jgi:tetratricopeptide (TPR) repeat protein
MGTLRNAPNLFRALRFAAFLALLACAGLLYWNLGWTGLVLAGASAALGSWARSVVAVRPRLATAERAWNAGEPASRVAELAEGTRGGSGHLAVRSGWLRGQAAFALGYRDSAWAAYLEADLAGLPMWRRFPASLCFRTIPKEPSPRRLAWTRRALRLAPDSARLQHLMGLLLLRTGQEAQAWEHFALALPLAAEDPMLLEDLMRAGFELDHPDLAEAALRQLSQRHGDPRLPWDRGAAAYHLLKAGRSREALALAMQVPEDSRTNPMHWLAEAVPLRLMGHLDGAAEVLDKASAHLPDAFPIWMERYKVALDRRRDDEALEALDRARAAIPQGEAGLALQHDWALKRAEAAFWIEDDPESAWSWIESLPRDYPDDHHPPLRLQLLSALGRFEEAHTEVKRLLAARPGDADLLLVQADCLAGLEAWKALLPFLDGLGDACRQSPAFWHLRGLSLAHLDDPIGSRVDLERAARMDPARLRHVLDAGHACAELGEWERAENHWRQALNLDPRCEEALIQLSDARRELRDLEGSRRYLRECLIHHPESADAQDRLAELEAN